jgi:small ligand-binding sensory domain FIST
MLSAGAGVAVNADGATAASEAARRALVSTGATSADLAVVFAGARHDRDEYAGVLSAVRHVLPRAAVIGCSATGVLSAHDELEDGRAVAVLAVRDDGTGGAPLPRPVFVSGVRADARAAGARLGRAVRAAAGGDARGAAVGVLVDPGELDAVDFLAGLAEAAPEIEVAGAGVSGGEAGCRVFHEGVAHADACVALVLPRELHPSVGMTQGCQGLGDPLTITAADGNLVLELDGRPSVEALRRVISDPASDPANLALRRMTPHLLAGIGELGEGGRSDYVIRQLAIAEGDRPALAVAEPVRPGQTLRFALRDAIAARDDMKAMLDEQAEARDAHPARFGVYFNCAERGSTLYGQPGLDPELIRRRFPDLPVVGVQSSFEIGPACGRPRMHMFSGVLLLAG